MFGRQPRTIAIVGNGGVDPALSDSIDGHDIVIRFNAAPHFGPAGTRTDILVINNIDAAGAAVFAAMRPELIRQTVELWLAHRPRVLIRRNRVDWGPRITALFPDATRRRYFPLRASSAAKKALRRFGKAPGKTASSGVILLDVVLRRWPGAVIDLYGFGHQGWEGHDWAAERAWIDSLAEVGAVRRF